LLFIVHSLHAMTDS